MSALDPVVRIVDIQARLWHGGEGMWCGKARSKRRTELLNPLSCDMGFRE